MSKFVLDSSAVTAVMRAEPGSENILPYLNGSLISCVNLAELFSLARSRGSAPEVDAAAVRQMQLVTKPFDDLQAMTAAGLIAKTENGNIGFADRACLALAITQQMPVLTGDRAWLKYDLGIDIRLFRNASAV